MKREKRLSIIVFFTSFILTKLILKKISKQKEKRSLTYRNLVSKDTEILNIYTKKYVDKDEKEIYNLKYRNISTVTTILKPTVWLRLLSILYSENKLQRKIVSEYVCDMNKLNENSTVVIHVASENEKCEYMKLRTKLYFKNEVTIRIKIVKFDEEQIFED